MREMETKWLDFMANSRGSNSGKGLCIEFLGLIVLLWRLQYLTMPLSTSSYNSLQYLTQLEVKTIPLSVVQSPSFLLLSAQDVLHS